ncbi:hypothetical protein FP828_03585 [bacterium]|nr:hypothetical protein [Candidatus Omnitrophota bacterium]MBA3065555.1 hypothetical protein [bacterium]
MQSHNFSIMSPTAGNRTDIPSILLSKAYTTDSENTIIRWGEIHRLKMRLPELLDTSGDITQTPDANPIIHYHRFITEDTGVEYLLVFTKKHVYRWVPATKIYDAADVFTCASDCEYWSSVSFNNQVILTNNVDKVQVWSISTSFDPLDSASGIEYATATYLTKAKYVFTYENYLFLGFTTENGTVFPQRVRWCDLGDETDWNTGDAGSAEVGKGDFITGFGAYQGNLIIFKERSYYRMWLVASTDIFNMSPLSLKVGCQSPDSIINDASGELYFFASNYTFRGLSAGEISLPIDTEAKTINPSYIGTIRGQYIAEYDQLWWAIPYGTATTTNNKVLTYATGKWGTVDMAISAFGNYARQAVYSWDTLPFATWDTWAWDKWDTREAMVGFGIDLGADYSGYTYALHEAVLDNGAAYSGYFVLTTDLADKQMLVMNKRLLHIQLYFKKGAAGQTATVYVKSDSQPAWQNAGDVSLEATADEAIIIKDLPIDYRGKTFLIKVSGANDFRFLGCILKFNLSGER